MLFATSAVAERATLGVCIRVYGSLQLIYLYSDFKSLRKLWRKTQNAHMNDENIIKNSLQILALPKVRGILFLRDLKFPPT